MSRIRERFKTILDGQSKALITYITAGDPDVEVTKRLVPILEQNGADIVELGVPFSDPLADGTTIQRASQRALQRGITLPMLLQAVEEIRNRSSIPLALMSYYNPIMRYGIETFVDHATMAGIDGVIVPDLPPEEAGELAEISRAQDFDLIFLVAPTSSVERIKLVDRHSTGFIYCVSLTGVTGARMEMHEGLNDFMTTVRAHADKPLAVGFGISTPEQARVVAQMADGVIVGSALVSIIEQKQEQREILTQVGAFVRNMKDSIVA